MTFTSAQALKICFSVRVITKKNLRSSVDEKTQAWRVCQSVVHQYGGRFVLLCLSMIQMSDQKAQDSDDFWVAQGMS